LLVYPIANPTFQAKGNYDVDNVDIFDLSGVFKNKRKRFEANKTFLPLSLVQHVKPTILDMYSPILIYDQVLLFSHFPHLKR
jgi:hypothetical protein